MKQLRNRREGFTLLALMGVLLTITLATLHRQVRLFSSLTAQTDTLQNGRFALSVLEKDLPTAGMNVPAEQPFIVYADTHVVAFNADYTSNVPNDPFAVHVDPRASEGFATAATATKSRRFTIPHTKVIYPDTSYLNAGQNSPAETITLYVAPDTSTARADDYLFYRKINGMPPDMIARGLLRTPGTPFFEYFRRVVPVGVPAYLELVPATQLPLRHLRPIHGAVDDTGAVARIDSVHAVRVSFRVTDEQRGARERIYTFTRTIPQLNVGLATKKTCGDSPILGNVNFGAQAGLIGESPVVTLTWSAATDDSSGEKDVVRYVIYRALKAGVLEEPYLSIPSGEAAYSYVDKDMFSGQVYYYSLVAQDCGSSLSGVASAIAIVP